MRQTKLRDKTPLHFESRNLNATKMETNKTKLKAIDWNGHLNSENCNTNFETFHGILGETMDKEVPKKLIHISGKRRYSEPWMTPGIEKSSRKCQQLYKKKPT